MKKLLSAIAVALLSGVAVAGPTCTQAEPSTWQNQDKFQAQLVEQGYQIKKFKVTDGNCYEIYGKNKQGQKVEIYFNPVDGKVVKTKTES